MAINFTGMTLGGMTFSIPSATAPSTINYLVVGGGGSGGYDTSTYGGGGLAYYEWPAL